MSSVDVIIPCYNYAAFCEPRWTAYCRNLASTCAS